MVGLHWDNLEADSHGTGSCRLCNSAFILHPLELLSKLFYIAAQCFFPTLRNLHPHAFTTQEGKGDALYKQLQPPVEKSGCSGGMVGVYWR